tara:strand:+ start:3520 stop:4683 length:1164 start_codon:yes stop_codon:yes gene_type:complete
LKTGLSKKTFELEYLVSILGFLTSIVISIHLWFPSENIFSPTPVFELIESTPDLIHSIITSSFILFLILSFFIAKHQKKLLSIFCFFLIVSLFLDQLRWQPWVFYYLFIFSIFVFIPLNKKQVRLNTLRLILALIYIWSGIQKINYTFLTDTYPWLVEPLTDLFSDTINTTITSTSFLAPLIEISAGIGLFFRKTQRFSAIILVVMHFFILCMIGPFGHNSNFVVWPWNITFSILLILLFIKENKISIFDSFKKRIYTYQIFILILFGAMPALSFFDTWPMYFSSALYSGNKIDSEIFLPDQFKEELPDYIKTKVEETNNATRLKFFVQYELNIPIYPTKEFHLSSFKRLCSQYPDYSFEFVLITYSKPNILTGEKEEETFFCDELN